MDRCALLAGFAVLAAVADQPDSLTVCFVEDQPAAMGLDCGSSESGTDPVRRISRLRLELTTVN